MELKQTNIKDKTILYVVPKKIEGSDKTRISIVLGDARHLVQRIDECITVLGTYEDIKLCPNKDYDLYRIKPAHDYTLLQKRDALAAIRERGYAGKVNFLEHCVKAKK